MGFHARSWFYNQVLCVLSSLAIFSVRKRKLAALLNLDSICNYPRHEISNNVVCVNSKGSDQAARTHSLIRAFASRLNIL